MSTRDQSNPTRKKFGFTNEETLDMTTGVFHVPSHYNPPVSDVKLMDIGKMKGIQGKDNSCYADSFLMSLFYTTNKFDLTFHLHKSPENISETTMDILKSLRNIIDELRKTKFCNSRRISTFRYSLSKIDNQFADRNMMDVIDLLNTLCGTKGLNIEPFLNYDTGTSNFYHQITVGKQIHTQTIDLQTLLERSLEFQKLNITSTSTPCLFLKMPRSAGKLIGFKAIIPAETLLIQMSKHKKPSRFSLHAVICLLHCHYTAFIKSSDGGWIFFDSMAEFKTPEVSDAHVVHEFLSYQSSTPIARIVESFNKNKESLITHLATNCHLCIYVEDGRSHTSSNTSLPATTVLPTITKPISKVTYSPTDKSARNSGVTPSLSSRRVKIEQIEDYPAKLSSSANLKSVHALSTETPVPERKVTRSLDKNRRELKSYEPKEAEAVEVAFPLQQRGFHAQSFKSGLASLQYALWRHTSVFIDSFDDKTSPEMIKIIRDIIIDPLQSTGNCDLDKFDLKSCFAISASPNQWPEPVVILKKMGLKPMFSQGIIGNGKVFLELRLWKTKQTIVTMDDALSQTLRDDKLKGLPKPAFVIMRNLLSRIPVLPSLALCMKKIVDNIQTKVQFILHAVICKTTLGFCVYVRTDDYNEENGHIWIYHDPTKGLEKELALDSEIQKCKTLADFTPDIRSIHENGYMWIYLPQTVANRR